MKLHGLRGESPGSGAGASVVGDTLETLLRTLPGLVAQRLESPRRERARVDFR